MEDYQRTLVTADIHGNYKALLQVLERSKFDKNEDRLIILGDICDGFPEVRECIDLFLQCKNIILIKGNHDEWALDWYTREDPYHDTIPQSYWTEQGGRATIKSYNNETMPISHIKFLQSALPYYIDDKNNLYVHGGFNPSRHIEEQSYDNLLWDRNLILCAIKKHNQKPDYKYGNYNTIFIGHTTTQCYRKLTPIMACNVIDLDTGAGWSGRLTIMDRDTLRYWQSDLCKDLYPEGSTRE